MRPNTPVPTLEIRREPLKATTTSQHLCLVATAKHLDLQRKLVATLRMSHRKVAAPVLGDAQVGVPIAISIEHALVLKPHRQLCLKPKLAAAGVPEHLLQPLHV